jgi:hypothetical protein
VREGLFVGGLGLEYTKGVSSVPRACLCLRTKVHFARHCPLPLLRLAVKQIAIVCAIAHVREWGAAGLVGAATALRRRWEGLSM